MFIVIITHRAAFFGLSLLVAMEHLMRETIITGGFVDLSPSIIALALILTI